MVYNGDLMLKWNDLSTQGFHELAVLKDRLKFSISGGQNETSRFNDEDDPEADDAEQMRRLFGVA